VGITGLGFVMQLGAAAMGGERKLLNLIGGSVRRPRLFRLGTTPQSSEESDKYPEHRDEKPRPSPCGQVIRDGKCPQHHQHRRRDEGAPEVASIYPDW